MMSVDEWDEVWVMTYGLSGTTKAAQSSGHTDQYHQAVKAPVHERGASIVRFSPAEEPQVNNQTAQETSSFDSRAPRRARQR